MEQGFNKINLTKGRFGFGRNWRVFVDHVDDERLRQAEEHLLEFFNADALDGKTFCDVGCGSGLFSLAARRLGAKVTSFDYDPLSVEACKNLKSASAFTSDCDWRIVQGDVLNVEFFESIGKFDVVYSWGVLHHTGAMYPAILNATRLVNSGGGQFLFALYNDAGYKSRVWWLIKCFLNMMPDRFAYVSAMLLGVTQKTLAILKHSLLLNPGLILRPLFNYKKRRGMRYLNDIQDWCRGFPYEYATTSQITEFMSSLDFDLQKKTEVIGLANNQFLFRKK